MCIVCVRERARNICGKVCVRERERERERERGGRVCVCVCECEGAGERCWGENTREGLIKKNLDKKMVWSTDKLTYDRCITLQCRQWPKALFISFIIMMMMMMMILMVMMMTTTMTMIIIMLYSSITHILTSTMHIAI